MWIEALGINGLAVDISYVTVTEVTISKALFVYTSYIVYSYNWVIGSTIQSTRVKNN